MAGLKGHKRGFLKATIEVALNDYTGMFPLYCETAKDGSLELVVGSYPEPKGGYLTSGGNPRDAEAKDFFERTDAVAPTPAKGGTMARCTLTIRNPASPDTKAFAKKHGHDLDEKIVNKVKIRDENGKSRLISDMSDDEIADLDALAVKVAERELVTIAGCIIAINNVPMDGDDDKSFMPYSDENAIELLRDLPLMVATIKAQVRDRKKFVSRS